VEGRPLKGLMFACALTLCAGAPLAASALAGLGPNPADSGKLINKPIEDHEYDPGRKCDKDVGRGMKLMVDWLGRHTRGEFWGIYRCEKWGKGSYSVHAESRAIDWAMDARDRKDKKQAMTFIRKRLLAPDRLGNDAALARRMGVQGLIFDCKAWFGYGGLDKYSYCFKKNGKRKNNLDPTQAHIDHIHIELNKKGARGKTSFWRSGIR
jgi:hypothetical protein